MNTTTYYICVPRRCKCRFCPKCAGQMGYETRQKLIKVLKTFKKIQMWTFTYDPAWFTCQEEAFRFIMQERMISKIVRKMYDAGWLHTRRYFWVLEFQQNGNAHWHVLVDCTYAPFRGVCDMWNKLGVKRAEGNMFGSIRFSKSNFRNALHAACYVTKYIIKEPEYKWPSWVLDYTGNIMRCRASNGFYDEVVSRPEPDEKEETGETYDRKQSVRDRVFSCGSAGVVLQCMERTDDKGEILRQQFKYVDVLPHRFETIRQMVAPKSDTIAFEVPPMGTNNYIDKMFWTKIFKRKRARDGTRSVC